MHAALVRADLPESSNDCKSLMDGGIRLPDVKKTEKRIDDGGLRAVRRDKRRSADELCGTRGPAQGFGRAGPGDEQPRVVGVFGVTRLWAAPERALGVTMNVMKVLLETS